VLRQPEKGIPAELFAEFKSRNNYFSTTIHVLVSATVKLAQTNKLQSGLKLYRGLGREFPDSFYKEDDFGRKGYTEWGFMSTTSDQNVARQVRRNYFCCFSGFALRMLVCFEVLWHCSWQEDRHGPVL